MFRVFPNDTEPGLYGIEDESGVILYGADLFGSIDEAQAIADAHNRGAQSYDEAQRMCVAQPAGAGALKVALRYVLDTDQELRRALIQVMRGIETDNFLAEQRDPA